MEKRGFQQSRYSRFLAGPAVLDCIGTGKNHPRTCCKVDHGSDGHGGILYKGICFEVVFFKIFSIHSGIIPEDLPGKNRMRLFLLLWFFLLCFLSLQVEVMEYAVEDRSHENCHRKDQYKSAVHCIKSCEDLPSVS